jgi:hypothetical protein
VSLRFIVALRTHCLYALRAVSLPVVIRYLADTPFFEALHPAPRTPGYIIYILVDTNAVVAELRVV